MDQRASPQTRDALLGELRAAPQRAEFTLERAAVDVDKRTVDVAFASEDPYERWFGMEVLDCSPKSVRMGRLKNRAAVLLNHDTDQQCGVVDAARLGGDKKGRATLRFSKSDFGQEILQDIDDGIRTKVSVGYMVHDLVLESQKGDVSTYRVTDWEPYEISIVSVPADDTVGVGRSAEARGTAAKELQMEPQAAQGAAATAENQGSIVANMNKGNDVARANEREITAQRNAEIFAAGDNWKEYGGDQLAREAILKPEMTVDRFNKEMLDLLGQKHKPTKTGHVEQGPSTGGVMFGMGAREMLHGHSLRAFKGLGPILGHGKADIEVAYRAGMWCAGAIFGNGDALRWCKDNGVMVAQGDREQLGFSRDLSGGVFSSAGWLVPVEMEAAIISNREKYGAMRQICRVVPMSSASTSFPRVTTDSTAYFVGEGTAGTSTDPQGDQVTLTLKDLMAITKLGKSTAQDTVIALAEFVAQEQARAFAIKEDQCAILGDGTSTYGGITGLVTLLQTAAYSGGLFAAASGHNLLSEQDVGDVTGVVGIMPIYARQGARWLVSGVADAMIFGRLKLNAGGNDRTTVQGQIVEQSYAGFPISLAQHMPSGGATDYANLVVAILGNFELGVAFGTGTGMMMTTDPYTLADKNQVRIITTERIDINCHGVNKSTTVPGPIVALRGTA